MSTPPKLFASIEHKTAAGVVDGSVQFDDRLADKKNALKLWTKCVMGKQPHTLPQEWNWVWAPKTGK